MTITIEAVYANGAFQPERPLELAEGTHVHLTVNSADPRDDPFDAVIGTCGGPTGGENGITPSPVTDDDPLEAVIGICDDGPDISLAARHDEFIYGLNPNAKAKP